MGRAPCCDKANVKKGPWSPEEDAKLKDYMDKNGTVGNWIAFPQKAGLRRCGKSCRLRWLNYLRPNIRHGDFSDDEDRIICTLFANIGSRWSIIAAQLPGRTDNDIKNYWNTKLKKKLFGSMQLVQSQRKPHDQNQIDDHHASFSSLLQSSSPSSSSTLLYNCSSNTYQTPPPPPPPPSSFSYSSTASCVTAAAAASNNILQPQESLFGPIQPYNQFGAGDQASCSTSSDGSCSINGATTNNGIHQSYNNNFYSDESHKQMVIMASNGDHGWSDHDHQKSSNGLWGETECTTTILDYGIEEIKQLITTPSSCNSFVFDENKADDQKVMYYY